MKALKEGEDQKTKTYNALCICPSAVDVDAIMSKCNSLKELELSQKTPIRVLHRRSNAVRKRTVYYMSVSMEGLDDHDDRLFKLEMSTQAGTYVKEFVHGDFMRTRPNLREILGFDVDIVALDVQSIDLDWPPAIKETNGNS